MPNDERFVVDGSRSGTRLDKLLAERPSIGSRGKARRALASGKVAVDGEEAGEADGGRACAEGTLVVVAWNRPGTSHARNAARRRLALDDVQVLHDDAELLALDKPPGMLTDAATRAQRREEETLTDRARAWVGRPDVWPVHRIDRDTSGVVLFAKSAEARAALKAQWEGEKPRRVYLAFLQGELDADPGWWAHWMRWNRETRRQEPSRPGAPRAVLGRSHVTVVERLPGATVVRVALDTGRRNQIRLSACLDGHPLVGERQYTPGRVGVRGPSRKGLPSLDRQALHAEELEVKHPSDGSPLVLRAPLPKDLARWRGQARRQGEQ